MIRGDDTIGKVVNFKTLRGLERAQSIAKEVRRSLEVWVPDLVVVEGYAFANKSSLVTLVEIGTAVKLQVLELKIPLVSCPPTVLKKWVTGKGNATKDEMAQSVFTRWGIKSPSDDVIDALALAKFGQQGLETVLKMKGIQHDR